jgi:hypothetical protein
MGKSHRIWTNTGKSTINGVLIGETSKNAGFNWKIHYKWMCIAGKIIGKWYSSRCQVGIYYNFGRATGGINHQNIAVF